MAGKLKVVYMVQSITNLNSDGSNNPNLLELSDYKIEKSRAFSVSIKSTDELIHHVDDMSHQINKFAEQFAGDDYKRMQEDVIRRVTKMIAEGTGCEHLYFVKGRDKFFAVRQLYLKKVKSYYLFQRTQYYLTQTISVIETDPSQVILFNKDGDEKKSVDQGTGDQASPDSPSSDQAVDSPVDQTTEQVAG